MSQVHIQSRVGAAQGGDFPQNIDFDLGSIELCLQAGKHYTNRHLEDLDSRLCPLCEEAMLQIADAQLKS